MLGNFKKLMTSRFLFTFAVQIQSIVLGWQMYVLTRDPLYLGLIGLAEAVPALSLSLPAGYVVDRNRPLSLYRLVIFVSLLSALVMFCSQLSTLGLTHNMQIAALFASSFLTGTSRSFSQPVIFALVPRIVKRADLSRSSAWMATTMQAARIGGPAVGGLLFGLIGVTGAAGATCAILALSFLVSIVIQAPSFTKAEKSFEPIADKLLSGARFVFRHPILLPALTLDMISVLFGGVTSLLPIFAAEILFVGPTGLGFLRAAPALGAVACGLWLTKVDFRKRAGSWLFTSVFSFGICILVFAISRSYILSFAALTVSGAVDSVSMVIRTSAVQLASPDHMRGRISSVNSMFIGSSNELGEFESGVTARLFGTVPSAIFGGTICIITVLVVGWFAPELRSLNLSELELAKETSLPG